MIPLKVSWCLDPVAFVREAVGFEPDAAQEKVLSAQARRAILCCSRQWGKSTVTALLALHRAVTQEGSLILALAPCERQSGLLVNKISRFAQELGIATKRDGMNKCSAVLPNGSAVIGLPGKEQYLRGYSAVSLLIVDEAARVQDELYTAMRPMLAVSDGDVWLMSTPFGRRGFFWQVWDRGEGEQWLRIRVPATECPRISADFLQRERRAQGEHRFRQEYLCEFVQPDDALFDEGMLRSLVRPPIPLPGRSEWWKNA
jgi:hypothetical protein